MNNRIIYGCTVLHTQRSQVEARHLDQHKEVRQHHLAALLEIKAIKFLTAENQSTESVQRLLKQVETGGDEGLF